MTFQKLFFYTVLIGVYLPICAMDVKQQPGMVHTPVNLAGGVPMPIRPHEFKKLPLEAYKEPENYNKLHQGVHFPIDDDKGYFEVTNVTPYKKHWLWGARSVTQRKSFERPRLYHPKYWPLNLATDHAYAEHTKNDNKPNDIGNIHVSSIRMLPTKSGLMAIGGVCAFFGLATYLNLSRHK